MKGVIENTTVKVSDILLSKIADAVEDQYEEEMNMMPAVAQEYDLDKITFTCKGVRVKYLRKVPSNRWENVIEWTVRWSDLNKK